MDTTSDSFLATGAGHQFTKRRGSWSTRQIVWARRCTCPQQAAYLPTCLPMAMRLYRGLRWSRTFQPLAMLANGVAVTSSPVLAVNTLTTQDTQLPWEGPAFRISSTGQTCWKRSGATARWDDLVQVGRKLVRIGSDGVMTRSGLRMHRSGWDALRMFQMLHNQSGKGSTAKWSTCLPPESGVNTVLCRSVYAHQLDSLSFPAPACSVVPRLWVAGEQQYYSAGRNQDVRCAPLRSLALYNGPPIHCSASSSKQRGPCVTLLEFLLHPKQHERIWKHTALFRSTARPPMEHSKRTGT